MNEPQRKSRGASLRPSAIPPPAIKDLGVCDYRDAWRAMRDDSLARTSDSDDQLWLIEHPPVYTLGRNADERHIADPAGVPVVRSDRGGQAAYHGPGQAVVYTLVDLRRRGLGVRRFVELLEAAVIGLLGGYGVAADRRPGAPGVYVGGRKIAALGLRVSRGRCYHGVALNVNMDLRPFERIVVCGMTGMAVTQLSDLAADVETAGAKAAGVRAADAGLELARQIADRLTAPRPPRSDAGDVTSQI